ncbi:MAG: hypothetical protein H0Z29_02430 [Candidatus Marinimicrobia bacterium]|nr:hypothetical protein [Candidatus Neomarinimicrobiota bacterium]
MGEFSLLRDFLKIKTKRFPVTTAYLTKNIVGRGKMSYMTELKKLIRYKQNKSYYRELSEEERNFVSQDFERILKFANEDFPINGKLTSVCFSSVGENLWEVVNFDVPFMTEVEVQPFVYIKPLAKLYSHYRNYGLVLVDKAKAKIFERRLGSNIEHFQVRSNQVESIKYGGYKGRDERSVERNIHNIILGHYKEVSKKVSELDSKLNFNWIILGGHRDVLNEFKKYLKDDILCKVLGEMIIGPEVPTDDAFKKVESMEDIIKAEYEKRLIQKVRELSTENYAVEGIQAVIISSRKRAVKTLLFAEDFIQKGHYCKDCGLIDTGDATKCPDCGNNLMITNDVTENLIHSVLENGGNIEVIEKEKDKIPGIAAILYFPIV